MSQNGEQLNPDPALPSAIRVLIADDHPVVREGLITLVERQADMTVVGEAGNGEEAVLLFLEHRPDIVLLDLRMPEMDGIQAIQAIRAVVREARIVMLTTYDDNEDIYAGLQAGAKAYLLKDLPRETLIETIRSVHAGRTCIPPEVSAKLAERMSLPELTLRERDVLGQLTTGKTNREIGLTLFITEGTVKAHLNSILGKLTANDRTHAVTIALKRGLVRLE